MLHIERLPPIRDGGRLIIIGDIHGCLGEFNALVDKCKYNPSRGDVLLLLGDLVNKGYDSIGVVRRAIELNAKCILGNHDVALLNHLYAPDMGNNNEQDPLWQLAQGFPADCVAYLKSLPYMYVSQQFNLIVVHAGLNPKLPLEEQSVWELIHMRSIDEKTGQCCEDLRGTLWAATWKGPQHVVFGHDARSGLQQHEFATGIDTACCYGKHLTAMVFPGKELVQVRSRFSQTKESRMASGAAKHGKLSPAPAEVGSPASPPSSVSTTTSNNNNNGYNSNNVFSNAIGSSSTTVNNNNNNAAAAASNHSFSGINVADLLTGQKRVTSNNSPANPPGYGQQHNSMGTPTTSTPPTIMNNNNANLGFNLTEFANKLNGGQQNQNQNASIGASSDNNNSGNNSIMRFFSNATPNNNNSTSSAPISLLPQPRTRQQMNSTPQQMQQQQQQQQQVKTSSIINDDDEVIVSNNNNKKKTATSATPPIAPPAPASSSSNNNNGRSQNTTPALPNGASFVPTATPAQQGKTPTCSRALAVRELCTAALPRPMFENIILQLLDPNNEHHNSHNHSNIFDAVLADSTIREAVWLDIGAGLLSRLEEGKKGDDMLLLAQDVFTAKPEIAKQIVKMSAPGSSNNNNKNTVVTYLNGIISAGKEKILNLGELGLSAGTIKDTVVCLK